MEGAGSKGDREIKNYPDFTPFSREEIDSYLVLILTDGINIQPQINFWFLQTCDSTIYGKNNSTKLFPRGGRRWEKFRNFFCMYDPCTDHKYIYAKHSLFKVRRMLQNIQINFELCWDPAQDLSMDGKTVGFQGRHKDNLRITLKDAGDGF